VGDLVVIPIRSLVIIWLYLRIEKEEEEEE
jgi:hypothetical protein